jgi:hypothetical protein
MFRAISQEETKARKDEQKYYNMHVLFTSQKKLIINLK